MQQSFRGCLAQKAGDLLELRAEGMQGGQGQRENEG